MQETPEIVDAFYDVAVSLKDEKGIFPHPLIIYLEGGKKIMASLMLEGAENTRVALEYSKNLNKDCKDKCLELVYGIDRFTKENQGTTLSSVLTCAYWNEKGWVPFIIEYDDDQTLPINWDNEFWNDLMNDEISRIEKRYFPFKVAEGE
jgi:hypothetical protein